MLHSETFLAFLITAISLTVVATVLSRARVPTIVGFVLTGILIGPSGLNWISSLPAAHTISELGAVLLMFSIGLEVSIEHLKGMMRPLLSLGFAQVGLTTLAGIFFFYQILGLDLGKAFIFASCLSLSSTAVVLKLLQEKRETETPYGRISLIVLLFQDIAVLPIMAIIPALAASSTQQQTGQSIWVTLLWITLFLIGCILAGRYVIPRLFHEVAKTASREVFFFSIVSLTFVIAYYAELSGLSMSLGAFVAGVLISESPYNKQALAELSPFRDVFLGFFFASVGMMVDLNFIYLNITQLAWLIPVLFAVKFTLLYVIVRTNSHSHGVSFASALALSQIGEFSFILATSALSFAIITTEEFQYFLSLAVSSLMLTPLLLSFGIRGSAHRSWPELARSLRRSTRTLAKLEHENATSHESLSSPHPTPKSVFAPRKTIVIGLGHAGVRTLQELQARQVPCIGVDINLQNVKAAEALGLEAIYGDSTSPDVLTSIGIHEAHLAVITVNSKQITARIFSVVKSINPQIKTLIRIHFLRDLDEFDPQNDGLAPNQLIISEAETANSIIHKALACYSIDEAQLATGEKID